jgi:hypothetical protein
MHDEFAKQARSPWTLENEAADILAAAANPRSGIGVVMLILASEMKNCRGIMAGLEENLPGNAPGDCVSARGFARRNPVIANEYCSGAS